MKNLWCVLLFLLVVSHAVAGDDWDPNEAEELLQTKWDVIASVLRNKDLDQKAKASQIDKIIDPIFDFALMGKLALGRKHWPKLTLEEREKFTQLFTKRLKVSYTEKIKLYTDEKAILKPAIQKKKAVHIPMELIGKEKKVVILYKLHHRDKYWKIYDVEIQGVSILLTYRSQFDDILSHSSVGDLLSQLEESQTR
ncbi:MAG: ABC transporter substrate-binding protein [Planctomycetes bacterium]|nr:ABC transporter substrate-binding protein [Planctomycetota bacterium]